MQYKLKRRKVMTNMMYSLEIGYYDILVLGLM